MTHGENIKTVREACVRENPTLACNRCTCCREKWELRKSGVCPLCEKGKIAPFTEDPTAADVLLALGEGMKGAAWSLDLGLRDKGILRVYALPRSDSDEDDTIIDLDLRATLSSWDEASVAALAALLKNDE